MTDDNKDFSFFLDSDDSDNVTKDTLEKLSHPFILSIVTTMNKILTDEQLDKLNEMSSIIWDKFNDSQEEIEIMRQVTGGENLLHVLINMKDFVKTFRMIGNISSTSKKLIDSFQEFSDNSNDDTCDDVGDGNTNHAKRQRNK